MPTTFHLRVWTRFLAPIDEVWKLKTDPDELEAEFRPWASLRVDRAAIARALAGEVPCEVAMRLGPGPVGVGIAWPATVDVAEPMKRFRDTSTNALYSRWEHEHLFEETPDGCRYVDAVTFVSRSPLQKLSAIATQRVFQHRHAVAAKRLPTDPQATGVAVLRVLVEGEEDAAAAG
jgi:ligand-binding SRPBCC domain-containing protein